MESEMVPSRIILKVLYGTVNGALKNQSGITLKNHVWFQKAPSWFCVRCYAEHEQSSGFPSCLETFS